MNNKSGSESEYLKKIQEALESGKRFVVSNGRASIYWKEFEFDVRLNGIIAQMEVGQTLAIASTKGFRVLRLETVKEKL